MFHFVICKCSKKTPYFSSIDQLAVNWPDQFAIGNCFITNKHNFHLNVHLLNDQRGFCCLSFQSWNSIPILPYLLRRCVHLRNSFKIFNCVCASHNISIRNAKIFPLNDLLFQAVTIFTKKQNHFDCNDFKGETK